MADTSEYPIGAQFTNPSTGQVVEKTVSGWKIVPGGGSSPRKITPQEEGELKDMREDARAADTAAKMAEQFVELNRKHATGAGYAIPLVGPAAAAMNPDVDNMRAITARLAPAQRQPGSGTTSDRDLSLYLQAIPNIQRLGTANQQIAGQARTGANDRAARTQFYEDWANQHGTLRGAEAAFQASRQAKPQAQPGGGSTDKSVRRPLKQMSNAELMALLNGGG